MLIFFLLFLFVQQLWLFIRDNNMHMLFYVFAGNSHVYLNAISEWEIYFTSRLYTLSTLLHNYDCVL